MSTLLRPMLGLLLVLMVGAAAAQETPDAVRQAITERINSLAPDQTVGEIAPTPLDGLYSVQVGAQVVYMSANGAYLIEGQMIDLEAGRSLTAALQQEARRARLDSDAARRSVDFPATGEERFVVTAFTDIDCTYCRRMHAQIEEYNELGITVRYLYMPRAGMNSSSFDKAVWTWCADDRQTALTRAKRDERIERATCENPVAEHLGLARELGVTATPTLFTPEGKMILGYRSPETLLAILEGRAPAR